MTFAHTVKTRVRYGETDQMGVVYHPNFLWYFEMGRTEFMRESGVAYAALEKRGCFLMVVEAILHYRANVGYDDEISIHTAVGDVGPASVNFVYEIKDRDGRLLCEGSTRLASCNREKKPIRLPREIANLVRGKRG